MTLETSSGLERLGIHDLHRGYAQGRFDPVDVFDAVIAATETIEPLHALTTVLHSSGRVLAEESAGRWKLGEQRGLLDGVPVTIKDSLALRGTPSTKGSRILAASPDQQSDELSVARLREAGAVFVAKTTMPEYAWAAVSDSPLHGEVRNAVDGSRTAGGSSGGSAVAVARGIGAVSIGSDGAGSIRIPAAFNGVVGFKATYGAIPALPSGAFGSLAHVGPLARSVADLAATLPILGRYDYRDPAAFDPAAFDPAAFGPATSGHSAFDSSVSAGWSPLRARGGRRAPLRIAFTENLGHVTPQGDVSASFLAAVDALESSAIALEPTTISWPDFSEDFFDVWCALLASELAEVTDAEKTLLSPGLQAALERGERLSASSLLRTWVRVQGAVTNAMSRFHQSYDLLLTPTMPIPAFPAGQITPDDQSYNWLQWTPYTWPFNITGQPAISVPAEPTQDGLPVGLQIVGRRWADQDVLALASAWEELHQSHEGPNERSSEHPFGVSSRPSIAVG